MKDISLIKIGLRIELGMQFYEFSLKEATIINGKKTRNEITKIYHVTTKWLPGNLYHLKYEVFDREHKSNELSTSEKEFVHRVAYMTNEISVTTNYFCVLKQIDNMQQIQDKTEYQISQLSKEYVGRKAENTYILLRKRAKTAHILEKDIYKNENFGLLLNSCYGVYKKDEKKQGMVAVSSLLKKVSLYIKEEKWISEINEDHIIVDLRGTLDNESDIKKIKEQLQEYNIIIEETDQPTISLYEGIFKFHKKTRQVLDAKLSIEFKYGEKYIKQVSYTLQAISHEEIES